MSRDRLSPVKPAPQNVPGQRESIALWQQLQTTARVIAAVRGGASATAQIEAVSQHLRPATQSIAFHVMRNLGRADALRRQLAPRTPAPLPDALLCTALALLSPTTHRDELPYEPFTLVDQAVECAKHDPNLRAQAKFINACLRRYLREADELEEIVSSEPTAQWNHPRWWLERVRRDHPRDWQDILDTNNSQAPMVLRVNVSRVKPADYMETLENAGIDGRLEGASGIVLSAAVPVYHLPGFADGLVSVQDGAAQLAAPLLLSEVDLSRPIRILDACAAPGGKTAHLLELLAAAGNTGSEVVAMDVDAKRCERIEQNLQRLKLSARIVAADAGRPQQWEDASLRASYDAVLLDAPCTASGIVRRHPDVRWLRREADVAQLSLIQAQLLAALWTLVKPGGRLLYCTCSVFKAEGRDQVQTFLAHNKDALLRPSPGHLIPHTEANPKLVPDNSKSDQDGFFYALLEKRMA